MRVIIEEHAWTAPDLYSQLENWAYSMFDFVHPWDWFIYGGSVPLDRHLWTIPTEFRASMVLFLSHFMVARLTPPLRLATWVGLIYWAIHWDRWEVILFWAGAFLAEIDLIRIDRETRNPPDLYLDPSKRPVRARRRDRLWRLFWYANMLCALFLASYPDEAGHDTPGYRYLTTLIPAYYTEKYRFWQSIAAVQLIWATNHCDQLKALYTIGPVQYLGKISFALYLMHGPVIHTIGYMTMSNSWYLTGIDPRWRFELGFFIAAIFIICEVIWAADIFWRLVDTPAVKFARWLESKCIVA